MTALFVLIGAALALLALGVAGQALPRWAPLLQTAVCLAGTLAALLGPGIPVLNLGAVFSVDGLSALILAVLFLQGACSAAQPGLLGAAALLVLAGNGLSLVLFAAVATLLGSTARLRWTIALLACLAAAMLLLAWPAALPDGRFAAIRAIPPEGIRATAILVATLGAAALTPMVLPLVSGAVLGLYLLARFLLDLAGPIMPGWWGIPVLALGLGAAVIMARRAASADDMGAAVVAAGGSTLGLSASGVGAALLARGADLLPLAATAAAASLLLALAWAVWGGLLLVGTQVVQNAAGSTELASLGGLLRRAPTASLALLAGLASMAALPLSAGFAAIWLLLQVLLSAGRLGSAVLALIAGGVSAVGLTVALLAAGALRLAGSVLLGAPRTADAAVAAEPSVPVRLAVGALALVTVMIGLCPWLVLTGVQPAVRQLTGAAAEGAGTWVLASAADSPGYAGSVLLTLLAACTSLAVWLSRGPALSVPPWRGGLAEDGPGGAKTAPLPAWPNWRQWRQQLSANVVLGALALVLAAAFGWAAQ